MELAPRFELGPQGFAILCISRFAMLTINMEGIFGIEPKHSESKSDALPLCYIPIVWRKNEVTIPNPFESNRLATDARSYLDILPKMVSPTGIEPVTTTSPNLTNWQMMI